MLKSNSTSNLAGTKARGAWIHGELISWLCCWAGLCAVKGKQRPANATLSLAVLAAAKVGDLKVMASVLWGKTAFDGVCTSARSSRTHKHLRETRLRRGTLAGNKVLTPDNGRAIVATPLAIDEHGT